MINPTSKLLPTDENSQKLMQFIEETRQGKFTAQQPILTDIVYRRIKIQEQESNNIAEEPQALLFGLSY